MSNLEELIRLIIRDELRQHLREVMYEFEYSYEFNADIEKLEKKILGELTEKQGG